MPEWSESESLPDSKLESSEGKDMLLVIDSEELDRLDSLLMEESKGEERGTGAVMVHC